MSCLLCFDFGKARIGVAVGNTITGTARPIRVIASEPETARWNEIANVMKEWQPGELVVGLPLMMDGTEQTMTVLARTFAEQLRSRFGKNVFEFDERMSSIEASQRFAKMRAEGAAKRKQGARLDALAASIILENFLADHGHRGAA
jgi:putative holliday junction resolvase